MTTVIDHLVIGAIDLEEGAAWAARTFGVAPGGRGAHVLMSTHNLLWRLDRVHAPAGAPPAYLEIVAPDPTAADPLRPRWFGLDDAHTRARLAARPRLLTWQVRVGSDLDTAIDALSEAGVDAGEALPVTRDALSWRLTVRPDGMLPLGGLCPTVIAWDEGSVLPSDSLPPSGLSLTDLVLSGPQPALGGALEALGAVGLARHDPEDVPGIAAMLQTPEGPILID
ncbi:MAG: VOC family protein [Pseudomonadota bacterium]